jgi:hypothetical protein
MRSARITRRVSPTKLPTAMLTMDEVEKSPSPFNAVFEAVEEGATDDWDVGGVELKGSLKGHGKEVQLSGKETETHNGNEEFPFPKVKNGNKDNVPNEPSLAP